VNQRLLKSIGVVSLVLSGASMLLFDKLIAEFANEAGGRSSFLLQRGTHLLEVASGFPISRYALSIALIVIAAVLFIGISTRRVAWLFLFAGSSQLVSRLVVAVLKGTFGRLRPFEVVANGTWDPHAFFAHGDAFPSGHTAHFWGLFFPLAFLFPRYRLVLSLVPLFIAVARVGVGDHWTSDVLASISICAAVTLLFVRLFRLPERTGR
jgi:membrane-associated phospholipid phosphatase